MEKEIPKCKRPPTEKVHKLHLSEFPWMIILSRAKRAAEEESIRDKRNPYRVFVGRPGRRIRLRSRGVHLSIILKWISRK